MDSIIARVRDNQDVVFTVAHRDIYIHLPSFALGCLVVATLGSVLKPVVGGLLVSAILFLKFAVILGGVLCCLLIITNNKGKPTARHENEPAGGYKYFDIPIEKERHRGSISIDEGDLYNNFVRKAQK